MKTVIVTVLALYANCNLSNAFAPHDTNVKRLYPFSLQVFESVVQADSPVFTGKTSKDQLSSVSTTDSQTKAVRQAVVRKKWGVDNAHANEYWFDARIHTLGNIGFGGALHAALAPISTKLIDVVAYDGVDVRAKVAEQLSKAVGKSKARVIDLCCGVGMSTRALRDAFPDAETVVGLDTSPQMIAMANFLDTHINFFRPMLATVTEQFSTVVTICKEQQQNIKSVFLRGNSEGTSYPDKFFDLVTIMYAFHEVPKDGRERILAEARRLLKPGGTLAVVDIASDYTPSKSMLAGEPYVIEYQKSFHNQIQKIKGFLRPRYETLVPGHVGLWLLQRA